MAVVRNDVIGAIKDKTDGEFTKVQIDKILSAYEETIVDAVASGEEVNLTGFIKIGSKDVPERVCRNPKTGDTFTKEASKKVFLKALKGLKECVK